MLIEHLAQGGRPVVVGGSDAVYENINVAASSPEYSASAV
jgi:hypothetical protein